MTARRAPRRPKTVDAHVCCAFTERWTGGEGASIDGEDAWSGAILLVVLKVRARASISLVMTSPGKDDRQFDGSATRVEAGYDESDLLETFLENTPDHVYFKDLDGRFTQISASLGALDGPRRPADARSAAPTSTSLPTRTRAPARAAELEVMRTGEPIVGLEEREVSGPTGGDLGLDDQGAAARARPGA